MIKPACDSAVLIKSKNLNNNYFSFTVSPVTYIKKYKPGNFVHIRLPNTDIFFRRAMSVASVNVNSNQLEFIFKIFGKGTTRLAKFKKNEKLEILGPLGNKFSLPKKTETSVFVAGGVGFPPLMYLASEMVASGYDPKSIHFFYGGKTAGDLVERNRIKKLGINLHLATDDGSLGEKGIVTKFVEKFITENNTSRLHLYGCGPEAMLKATDDLGLKYKIPGEISLEAPMPCGIGICLGCIVPLKKGGNARVCCEGPVFKIGDVIL